MPVAPEAPPVAGPVLRGLRFLGAKLQAAPRPVFAGLAVGWFAWIAHLSSGPIEFDASLPFGSFLTNLAHAPLFGLAAVWLCGALARRSAPFPWPRVSLRSGLAVVALIALYGIVDEWHQSGVPERSGCWLDALTDTTAAVCVVWTVHFTGQPLRAEGSARLGLLVCVLACLLAAGAATAFCA